MKRSLYAASVILLTSITWASVPAKTHVDFASDSGNTEFVAVGHPSALKIHGKGPAPQGELTLAATRIKGTLTFDLASLNTGISMRDHHMKEKYLEVGKYPRATLRISRIQLSTPLPSGDFKLDDIPFEGPLTLHGKTVPVKGTVSLAHAGSQLLVNASFALKISDYAIALPTFAGITMADEVTVHVEAKALEN